MGEQRAAFAHEGLILGSGDFDSRAPGGAVTVALCGELQHDGPCPVAPHHTSIRADGARMTVRVIFAAEPVAEEDIRRRITAALEMGRFRGPDGVVSQWTLEESRRSSLYADEHALAERLRGGG